jgi:hypothetical protein
VGKGSAPLRPSGARGVAGGVSTLDLGGCEGWYCYRHGRKTIMLWALRCAAHHEHVGSIREPARTCSSGANPAHAGISRLPPAEGMMRREPRDPSEPRSHFRVMAWSRGRPARALRRTKTLNRAGARGEQATPLARTWRRRGPGDLGTDPYVRTAVRGGGRSALRRAHGGRWRRGAAGGWWRRGAAKCWGRIQKSGGGDPALFFAVKLVLNRLFEEHFQSRFSIAIWTSDPPWIVRGW